MTADPERVELSAEEIIAEVYRRLQDIRAAGESPKRIVMPPDYWRKIGEYRRSLGPLAGPLPDYLSESGLFGIEVWYGTVGELRVE